MIKAFIVSTGTELLKGSTVDSNSVYLAQQLGDLGIEVVGKATVGDSRDQLLRAFQLGMDSADMVISSGGLGPTFDDLTKEVACEIMQCQMELRDEELDKIREYFESRGRRMPDINFKQAMFPSEARVLRNVRGTAPGMYLHKDEKLFVLLPGPPGEMITMFYDEVRPLLLEDFADNLGKIKAITIKVMGPGESQVEEMLGDILKTPGFSNALLARDGEIHIKIAEQSVAANEKTRPLEDLVVDVEKIMAKNIFAYDDQSLVSKVAGLLKKQEKNLAVAESCTGGLLSKMLTDMPGSSEYFWGSVVSYSNQAKNIMLGVKSDTLERYGAVSKETAEEMGRGILDASGADLSLSITGLAGPGGGSDEKPVGLVYIALADQQNCFVKKLNLAGNRERVRILTAKSALDILRRYLEGIDNGGPK